ncbi:MAG: hypothetical protein KIT31_33500 [Deltaproteobacteria bacterium]|nr:hypothetical protein [Deltaproteobacteria bacterium]
MRTLFLVACLHLASTGGARADLADHDLVARPLTVERGRAEVQLVVEPNLANRVAGVPTSFAIDAWVGVTSRLTVGLTHSDASLDRLAIGGGLCLSGPASCARYRGPNVDVRWSWRDGALAIAPRARFLVRATEPLAPAVTAGALVRWRRGAFAAWTDPYLQLALAQRREGNRDRIVVPVVAGRRVIPGWFLGARTGWDTDVAVARDGWHVPIAFVIHAQLTRALDLRIEAGWPSLLGPQNDFKLRSALISVGWR